MLVKPVGWRHDHASRLPIIPLDRLPLRVHERIALATKNDYMRPGTVEMGLLVGAHGELRDMIDFSHGNSGKDPHRQVEVGSDVAIQIADGDERIFGVMVESHLKAGRQDLLPGKELVYGLSITDACIGWEDSRRLLDILADAVRRRRLKAESDAEAE